MTDDNTSDAFPNDVPEPESGREVAPDAGVPEAVDRPIRSRRRSNRSSRR